MDGWIGGWIDGWIGGWVEGHKLKLAWATTQVPAWATHS